MTVAQQHNDLNTFEKLSLKEEWKVSFTMVSVIGIQRHFLQ